MAELPDRDDQGYLKDPADWSEAVAQSLADAEGISLGDEHWTVIRFMRGWLEDRQVAPDARHVMKHLAEIHGGGRNRLFELFPYGYVSQACKIAGLRRPRSWSTG
jgi:tRNA 2-thiouridine synthesizing protein E